MKIQKLLALTILSFLSLIILDKGYTQEQPLESTVEASFEKIYTTPDRIFLCPEGIFYLNECGDLTPVRFVASDSSGLYYVADFYRCPACRRFNRDNICQNTNCVLYGK